MAADTRLKNEFTEDEKHHGLMSWIISRLCNLIILRPHITVWPKDTAEMVNRADPDQTAGHKQFDFRLDCLLSPIWSDT